MAVPAGVKLDDGTGGYTANCFPVRNIFRPAEDVGGAWLVAQRAEQRRRFKAILCTKPKTYDQLKEERKQREREERQRASASSRGEDDETPGLLDGFFLMKHCCVEDPSDLCSVNITGQDLSEAREDDFQLFDNVAYVNAAENLLPFEAFKHFPIIRELEIPVNGLRNLKIDLDDFPFLEVLDLSYNNLSNEDILTVGLLPKLKVLHLSGNGLKSLPAEMAQPIMLRDDDRMTPLKISRFANLEILYLDDNKLTDLTTFANLAGIRKLKRLNLDKNDIYSVPHLRAVGGKMVESLPPSVTNTPRHTTPRNAGDTASQPSSRKSSRGNSRKSSKNELEVIGIGSLETKWSVLSGISRLSSSSSVCSRTSSKGDTARYNSRTILKDSKSAGQLGEEIANVASISMIESTLKDIKEEDEVDENLSFNGTGTQIGSDLFTSESPPPFPELEYLSLAHNKILEEEGLLAVAAWPMLTELVIHNNPLTTENSGDPPLLRRYLVDRLGIHLTRLKPPRVQKPGPKVPIKKSRQVSSHVPKVPKVPVEQLMLEAPSRLALPSSQNVTPHPPPPRAKSAPTPSSLDQTKPLPPITPTPPPPKKTPDGWTGEDDRMSRTKTWTEDNFGVDEVVDLEEEVTLDDKPPVAADDPVFLTQVDDQGEEPLKEETTVKIEKRKHKKKERIDSAAVSMVMPEKYKGYELLLDVEEDPDIMFPPDIHGNVKALEYALKHPVVFKDNTVDLDRLQKPFAPYERSKVDFGAKYKDKAEKLEEMLEQMKNRVTTEEANLAAILEDKKKFKKEFPEAVHLLSQIQTRYKTVRAASIKDGREKSDTLEKTLEAVNESRQKLRKNKSEAKSPSHKSKSA